MRGVALPPPGMGQRIGTPLSVLFPALFTLVRAVTIAEIALTRRGLVRWVAPGEPWHLALT